MRTHTTQNTCTTTTTLQQHLKKSKQLNINIKQKRDQENSREWRDPRITWVHHKTKNGRQLRLTARFDCVSRRHSKETNKERQLRHTEGLTAVSRGHFQKNARKTVQLKGWSDFRKIVIFLWKKVITCITGNFYFCMQSFLTMRGSMLPSTFKVLFRMLSTAFVQNVKAKQHLLGNCCNIIEFCVELGAYLQIHWPNNRTIHTFSPAANNFKSFTFLGLTFIELNTS